MKITRGRKKFSSTIVNVCDVYLFICFCFGFPLKEMRANNRFREDSRGLIETMESYAKKLMLDPAISFTVFRGIRPLQMSISNITANTKIHAKRL
jgi:hypothetical protein